MTSNTLFRRGHPIFFGTLILFTSIELALSAWLTARYNQRHNYGSISVRDRVRFVLFSCVWTLAFSIPLLLLLLAAPTPTITKVTSVGAHVVFLLLAWIMWTSAAAAVTEMLGGGLNCSTQKIFVYCGQLNALEAFAWIIWILVTFAVIAVILRAIQVARRGDGYGGSLVDD